MKKIFFGALVGGLAIFGIVFANKITDDNAFLPTDAKNQTVQVPAGFQTRDVTGTPKTSPLAVSSTEIVVAVPDGAAELVIVYTSAGLRISEITGMARYFVLPTGGSVVLPVANIDNVYLKRDSGDATVQFFFSLLEN